ncbi:MAG: YggU family protein [Betaproteobacteria bacterium]|nr:YggU family protein [Betaproteobacteria bacterium]
MSRSGGASWALAREEDGAIVLALHVQPGAKRTEAAGTHGDALKIRLAAPPVDGKANAELVRFLADAFGVPQRQVTIVRGETSRQKSVRIDAPAARPDRGWSAADPAA